MIYICKPEESFDAEQLRVELVAAIGADGWHLNSAGNQVEFVDRIGSVFHPVVIEAIIQAHFTNGPKRDHNKAIYAQILELEKTQTNRRIREGGAWLADLEAQIAVLRSQLQ